MMLPYIPFNTKELSNDDVLKIIAEVEHKLFNINTLLSQIERRWPDYYATEENASGYLCRSIH